MAQLIDEPYERESVKEDLEEIAQAWGQAKDLGGILVCEHRRAAVPCLDEMEGVIAARPTGITTPVTRTMNGCVRSEKCGGCLMRSTVWPC